MPTPVRASFRIAEATDTLVLLVDRNQGMSVTNDAEAVVAWLGEHLAGGIGQRRVFYRDTEGRFDKLVLEKSGAFAGLKPGSQAQQAHFARIVERQQ